MKQPFVIVKKPFALAGVAALSAVLLAAGLWHIQRSHISRAIAPRLVYTAQGYGGFIPVPSHPTAALNETLAPPAAPADAIQPVRDAYNAGRYLEVEQEAVRVVAQAQDSRNVTRREQAVEAHSLLAYAAARRHDLRLARARFVVAQQEAAQLPDRGKPSAEAGAFSPTLEEDSAYQCAVCTGALGDKTGAEAEYLAFMNNYPESVLVRPALDRIGRLHGGKVPPAAQAAWQQAQQEVRSRQNARARETAQCGPDCLAELLRRKGRGVAAPSLAVEMHTGARGTSLADLAATAQAHGFRPQGLRLTQKGLREQSLPVIALLMPGHYVVVDALAPAQITLWDPDAAGPGKGGRVTMPLAQWHMLWHGLALALHPAQTAQR